jgi:hypothetical protein
LSLFALARLCLSADRLWNFFHKRFCPLVRLLILLRLRFPNLWNFSHRFLRPCPCLHPCRLPSGYGLLTRYSDVGRGELSKTRLDLLAL